VAHLAEGALQRIALGQRRTQRVPGIDTGHRQRHRIEPGAIEGLDVKVVGFATAQRAIALHVDEHDCDLEQRVGPDVEAARLHIDRDR